ncbi:Lateral signaling target protein 2 [Diplonema papillatum]|nr:Lateral signaling target protein 2 [Diplonema papillatum]
MMQNNPLPQQHYGGGYPSDPNAAGYGNYGSQQQNNAFGTAANKTETLDDIFGSMQPAAATSTPSTNLSAYSGMGAMAGMSPAMSNMGNTGSMNIMDTMGHVNNNMGNMGNLGDQGMGGMLGGGVPSTAYSTNGQLPNANNFNGAHMNYPMNPAIGSSVMSNDSSTAGRHFGSSAGNGIGYPDVALAHTSLATQPSYSSQPHAGLGYGGLPENNLMMGPLGNQGYGAPSSLNNAAAVGKAPVSGNLSHALLQSYRLSNDGAAMGGVNSGAGMNPEFGSGPGLSGSVLPGIGLGAAGGMGMGMGGGIGKADTLNSLQKMRQDIQRENEERERQELERERQREREAERQREEARKKDEWTCPVCTLGNPTTSAKCNACETPAPPGACRQPPKFDPSQYLTTAQQQHLASQGGASAAGSSWTCNKCYHSANNGHECRVCGASKSAASQPISTGQPAAPSSGSSPKVGPDEWECEQCTYVCKLSNAACTMCDARKPQKVIDREKLTASPDGWACPMCTLVSPWSAARCSACNTSAPQRAGQRPNTSLSAMPAAPAGGGGTGYPSSSFLNRGFPAGAATKSPRGDDGKQGAGKSGGREKIMWQSDTATTNCNNCNRPFTLTLRRHHCRLCGFIFCHPCSSHTITVQGSLVPERVCDGCFSSRFDS